ncbi:hypothetical protein OHB26_35125 [Nocardia sp. NBC_01503]|uniref:hypothetical protein n=1 Tax=Nocardia sp. NBC_01503 TaxID=2975997 RepID=UPI002E7C56A7|nr:hypothetical protein [Nocardia sp. NBC_01503]WTL32072.1 hypothetical protein OHB26_35125 [Nocardia sp. NBC_01503]
MHDHIVAYRIDGPLFFAAARRFLLEFAEVSEVHVVILRTAPGTPSARARESEATAVTSHMKSGHHNAAPRKRTDSGSMGAAVVGVWGSRRNRTNSSCWTAMEDYAALLTRRTALHASAIPFTARRPYSIAERITKLPHHLNAVFLIGPNAAESAAVQSITAAQGGRLVISETDALTTAVAAAAATALRARRVPPRHGRLAVIGADRTPRLAAVLLECGAASVTAEPGNTFSGAAIRKLIVDHDITVDLTGQDSMWTVPTRVVEVPADPYHFAALALPGLLGALCGHGTTQVTISALAAAARALALITPVGRRLPDVHDQRLDPTVAQHVSKILDAPPNGRTHTRG